MSPAAKKAASNEVTVYLEALPGAVRKAFRAEPDPGDAPHDFTLVECRASDPSKEEHGKTTLVYTYTGDDQVQKLQERRLIRRANRILDEHLRELDVEEPAVEAPAADKEDDDDE